MVIFATSSGVVLKFLARKSAMSLINAGWFCLPRCGFGARNGASVSSITRFNGAMGIFAKVARPLTPI